MILSTDNNYFYPTIVCLTSVLENKKEDTSLNVTILVSSDFKESYKDKIRNLKNRYNFEVSFFDMSGFISNGRSREWKSKAVFYRTKLPSILENIDKCLYLDVDTNTSI